MADSVFSCNLRSKNGPNSRRMPMTPVWVGIVHHGMKKSGVPSLGLRIREDIDEYVEKNKMYILCPKGKAATEEHIRRVTDRVFDHVTHQFQTSRLSFQELYMAVLLVYNDLNKHIPGPHYDPPTRDEVREMFENFDTNKDNELSKEEFALFMEKFTSKFVGAIGRTLLIFCIVAPALAFFIKQETEDVPHIGKFVRGIPTPVYASIVTALIILAQRAFQRKWRA